MVRVSKITNVMNVIKKKASKGKFMILPHAITRRYQRKITVNDIIQVLTTGWHEIKKDEYKKEHEAWNYSIRGKTIDEKQLRIAVSFDEDNMLIITVINIKTR